LLDIGVLVRPEDSGHVAPSPGTQRQLPHDQIWLRLVAQPTRGDNRSD
jgi:hypothetical protein